MAKTMDIFLLPKGKGRYILFSEEFQKKPPAPPPEEPEEPNRELPPPSKKRKVFRALKAVYTALTEKGRRSERILKGIRRVKRIYVFYPAHLSEEEAQDFYDEIVETQIKKHKRWLIVDGVLLPFSAIFTLVPGPNVLLIYLAWRTLAHYQTKKGGEKAADDLKVSFHKEPQLDKLESLIDKSFVLNRNGRIKRIGERLGIEDLDQLY